MIGLATLLDLDLEGTAWMLRGNCAQVGGDTWHPEKGGNTLAAKVVCRRCPVKAECLAYALERDERFGVWGGMSERERRALKRQSGQVAA